MDAKVGRLLGHFLAGVRQSPTKLREANGEEKETIQR